MPACAEESVIGGKCTQSGGAFQASVTSIEQADFPKPKHEIPRIGQSRCAPIACILGNSSMNSLAHHAAAGNAATSINVMAGRNPLELDPFPQDDRWVRPGEGRPRGPAECRRRKIQPEWEKTCPSSSQAAESQGAASFRARRPDRC